jgi:hypothetical protein
VSVRCRASCVASEPPTTLVKSLIARRSMPVVSMVGFLTDLIGTCVAQPAIVSPKEPLIKWTLAGSAVSFFVLMEEFVLRSW